jgi:type IV pilus assembly protein PilP
MVILFGLSACSNKGTSDLQQYVQERKKNTKAQKIKPLPEIKRYQPYLFINPSERDPFQKPMATNSQLAAQSNIKRLPDENRVKGPLEEYAIGQMKLVGIIQQGTQNWALIKNGDDRNVYSVKTGDFVGKDNGKIDAITADTVFITEIIKGPSGLWEEKKVEMILDKEEQ